MAPAFHRQRIEQWGAMISRHAARVARRWTDGQPVDVHREMTAMSMAIAAKMLFDADIESETGELAIALREGLDLFQTVMVPLADLLDRLPLGRKQRFAAARARLDSTIYRIIAERRADGRDHGDVLSMLLQAEDSEGTGGMNDEQLRDECMTLFLAGHETIANALSWSWYLLSLHPVIAERLQAETDGLPHDRLPDVGTFRD